MHIVTSRRYIYRKMIFDQNLKKREESNIINRILYNFTDKSLPDEEPIPAIKSNLVFRNVLVFENKFRKLGITTNVNDDENFIMKYPEIETKYLTW